MTTKMEEFECSCPKCVAMCQRFPCRPLPEDVRKMLPEVRARLMIREDDYYTYLQAAAVNYEGREAPDFGAWFGYMKHPRACTFLTEKGLCELHGKCKPWEGRVTIHGDGGASGFDVNDILEEQWNSRAGQRILRKWRKENANLEPAKNAQLGTSQKR